MNLEPPNNEISEAIGTETDIQMISQRIQEMCMPVDTLTQSIENLPPEFRSRDVIDYIKSFLKLTVELKTHRPTIHPVTIIGKITQIIPVNDQCNCIMCEIPGASRVNDFWNVFVMFANFDSLKCELENLDLCKFFVSNRQNMRKEINARLVTPLHDCTEKEWISVLLCIHERELGEYLVDCFKKFEHDSEIIPAMWNNGSILDNLTFAIFSYNDCIKKIILGVWKSDNEEGKTNMYSVKDLVSLGALVYRVGWKNDPPYNRSYSSKLINKFVELHNPEILLVQL